MGKERVIAIGAVVAVFTAVSPAHATFPGRNGRIAFSGAAVDTTEGCSYGGEYDVNTMDPDGTNIRNITDNDGASDVEPVWSPDGKTIAYTSWQGESESADLRVIKADGSGRRTLTSAPSDLLHPSWSDHGFWIAFQSSEEAGHDISRVRSDGSRVETVLATEFDETMPSYAPDGGRIAYVRDGGGGGRDIWTVRPDGSRSKRLTRQRFGGFSNLGWSPDGRFLIFTANRGEGASYIYRLQRNGRGLKRLVLGRDPAWSPNGRTIIYQGYASGTSTQRGCTEELFRMHPDGSHKRKLPKRDDLQMLWLDWQAR